MTAATPSVWVPELVPITIKPRARETLAQLAYRMDVPLVSLQRWNPSMTAQRPLNPSVRVALMVAPENQAQTLAQSQAQPAKETKALKKATVARTNRATKVANTHTAQPKKKAS